MTRLLSILPGQVQSPPPIDMFRNLQDVDWPQIPLDNSVIVFSGNLLRLVPGLGSAAFEPTTAFEPAGAVATHAALTTTHGLTSPIVGSDDNQTLTNKTIISPSIISPTLSGIPTAPTAPSTTNTIQVATTAYVTTAVTNHTANHSNPHVVTAAQVGLAAFIPDVAPLNGQTLIFNAVSAKYVPTDPSVGDLHRLFALNPPATLFHIQHGMGKRPAVRIVDSGGNELICDVQDDSFDELNAIYIRGNFEFSGMAILN